MKVAAVFEDGTAGVVDRPTPTPNGDNVLVKIHVAATCTEYKSFRDGTRWDMELGEPVPVGGPNVGDSFGHEAVGEVVEVANPGQAEVGDRVVVMWWRGCGACSMCEIGEIAHCRNLDTGNRRPRYAQYTLQKDWLCSPIPDGVSYKQASAGLCGMGPSFEAMDLMRLDSFDTVLITGLGPVGLGGVINASYRGARIIAVESIPYRANLGKELGAEVVIDPSDVRGARTDHGPHGWCRSRQGRGLLGVAPGAETLHRRGPAQGPRRLSWRGQRFHLPRPERPGQQGPDGARQLDHELPEFSEADEGHPGVRRQAGQVHLTHLPDESGTAGVGATGYRRVRQGGAGPVGVRGSVDASRRVG